MHLVWRKDSVSRVCHNAFCSKELEVGFFDDVVKGSRVKTSVEFSLRLIVMMRELTQVVGS